VLAVVVVAFGDGLPPVVWVAPAELAAGAPVVAAVVGAGLLVPAACVAAPVVLDFSGKSSVPDWLGCRPIVPVARGPELGLRTDST
jgi:hypothetical protein